MGYRSKVIFGVSEEHKDKFNELINKADRLCDNEKDKYVCTYFKDNVKIVKPKYMSENFIIFEDDDLKWIGYEGDENFPYIDLINDTIMEWFDGDDDMGAFRICLGEDGYKDECGEWYDVVSETHKIWIDERVE